MISRKQYQSAAIWLLKSRLFVSKELANYPGRLNTALRLTLACTATLVLVVLFKIPGASLGVYFPFLLARDGLRGTVRSASLMSVMALLATADIIAGAMLFVGSPLIHFLWIVLNLLVVFFLISTCRSYETVLGFGLIVTAAITVWDRPIAAHARAQVTLFSLLSVLIACACTLAVETIFQNLSPIHFVRSSIHARLSAAAKYLDALGDNQTSLRVIKQSVLRLSHRGTAEDCRHIHGYALHPNVSILVGFSGRLIDLLAVWSPSSEDRLAARRSLLELSDLLRALLDERSHFGIKERRPAVNDPLLHEIRETVYALAALEKEEIRVEDDRVIAPQLRSESLFVQDSFSNPKHIRFAIRGALSALACYCAYMSVGWSGLSSALSTCILTAVPVLGATRHRQLLRLAGMVVGAGVCGLLAESLFLSQMDSLLPFTVLFAAFSVVAAWIASSTPRLAFAGLQVAFAFDIVVLNRFSVNPQLIAARDCILGIILGILAMWLIFDQLWRSDSEDVLPTLLQQAIRSHALPVTRNVDSHFVHSLATIRASEDTFRAVDRLQFLFELRAFEEGIRARPHSRVFALKKFLEPLRKMTALAPVAYPGRDLSLSGSTRLKEIFERTLLGCVAFIEGHQPRTQDDIDALSQLEAELLGESLEQGSHAESERRATLSYIDSLRRLQRFSERYYIKHYVDSRSPIRAESNFLLSTHSQ